MKTMWKWGLVVGVMIGLSSAVAFPGHDVVAAGGPTPIPSVELDQTTTDMVFDEVHQLLYAVTPSNARSYPQSLIAIDAFTWEVVDSVLLPSAGAARMWISPDSMALYIRSELESAVRQFDTPTLDLRRIISVTRPSGQSLQIIDVAVSPVDHDTIAVSAFANPIPGGTQISIIDHGVTRPDRIDNQFATAPTLAWNDTGSMLFGARFTNLVRMSVGPNGVSELDNTPGLFADDANIDFFGGRLYDSTGRIVNATSASSEGQFESLAVPMAIAFDFPGGKAYIMSTNGDTTLRQYDVTTHAFVRSSPTIKDDWPMQLVIAGPGYLALAALHREGGGSSVYLLAPGVFDGARGEYTPLTPTRILDTRDGTGRGGSIGPVGAGQSITVQVAGVGGVPSADKVDSVVLNATVTNPTIAGFLTVWPHGSDRPFISNLNFVPGQTVANLVTVALGLDGALSVYNNAGTTDVIFDVAGFYSSGDGPRGQRYHALEPSRLFDTRDGSSGVGPALGQGGELAFKVTGRGGVPASGVTAVAMNVTVTEPTSSGFLTVYPGDVARPLASNLNVVPGLTVPNLVIVRMPPSGIVKFFNSAGSSHVLADVVGYYDADRSSESGRLLTFVPFRWADTREDSPFDGNGSMPPQSILALGDKDETATGYVLNVTVTEPTNPGYLTVFPDDLFKDPPLASNLNFVPGQTVPNLVLARTGPYVSLYNSNGNTHVIVDVFGWFT